MIKKCAVKIDVEGFEGQILRGSKSLLQTILFDIGLLNMLLIA